MLVGILKPKNEEPYEKMDPRFRSLYNAVYSVLFWTRIFGSKSGIFDQNWNSIEKKHFVRMGKNFKTDRLTRPWTDPCSIRPGFEDADYCKSTRNFCRCGSLKDCSATDLATRHTRRTSGKSGQIRRYQGETVWKRLVPAGNKWTNHISSLKGKAVLSDGQSSSRKKSSSAESSARKVAVQKAVNRYTVTTSKVPNDQSSAFIPVNQSQTTRQSCQQSFPRKRIMVRILLRKLQHGKFSENKSRSQSLDEWTAKDKWRNFERKP